MATMSNKDRLRHSLLVMFSLPYESKERDAAAKLIYGTFPFVAIVNTSYKLQNEGLVEGIEPGKHVSVSGKLTEMGQEMVTEILRIDQEAFDAKKAEPPKVYMLQVSERELQYLTIGNIANAAVISQEKRYGQLHLHNIRQWTADVEAEGMDPIELNNQLVDRLAKLGGAPFCNTCNFYHDPGAHS